MHRHIWILDLRGREGWKGLNISVWYSVWFLHTSFLYGARMFKSQRAANSYQTYHCPRAVDNGGVYTVENMSCWRYKWKHVCFFFVDIMNGRHSFNLWRVHASLPYFSLTSKMGQIDQLRLIFGNYVWTSVMMMFAWICGTLTNFQINAFINGISSRRRGLASNSLLRSGLLFYN